MAAFLQQKWAGWFSAFPAAWQPFSCQKHENLLLLTSQLSSPSSLCLFSLSMRAAAAGGSKHGCMRAHGSLLQLPKSTVFLSLLPILWKKQAKPLLFPTCMAVAAPWQKAAAFACLYFPTCAYAFYPSSRRRQTVLNAILIYPSPPLK